MMNAPRVLMITQTVDRQDPLLGFTHDWVLALAARAARVVVLALTVGEYDLPEHVTVESMGKDDGRNRLGVLAGLYSGLNKHLGEVDAVFVHMVPRYAWLAAPLAKLRGRPITLWYTHRSADVDLRMSMGVVKHAATAHPTSFPLDSPKVLAIGHGIDTNRFYPAPPDSPPDSPPVVLSLGRLSPIKRHEALIQAAAICQDEHGLTSLRCQVMGVTPPGARDYHHYLEREIKRLYLRDRVTLAAPIPSAQVPGLLRRMSAAVNLSPPGLFDKAALEAMLCGVPVIVANDAFDDLLGDHAALLRLQTPAGDAPKLARELADKLAALMALSLEERRAIALDVCERAAAAHNLDHMMDRLVQLLVA